ncbi:MBL fold metallo-hydrolase [Jannaschia sp. LMIT008]|uniref:MBL fold metallo-hydrolase n=1 Tax=Jannaschia maritima TaxID=3032585 RepID=UPI002810F603|nr:MBL fold metallo-hydrolase [Jannaschia sp. LMIT008]
MTAGDRLVILGSKGGPAIRPGGPNPTASLLCLDGRRIVVDCGLGVTRGLVDTGMDLRDLDLIVLTHLHSDHCLELGPLIHTAWTSGLATPVTVWGPRGTAALWDGFLSSLAFDVALRIDDEGRPDLAALVDIREYDEGSVNLGGIAARTLRVDHPPVTDCFGWRFDGASWSVCFSADTAYHPPLIDLARGADVLVHEAMLEAGVDRLVARTANGTRLKQHIVRSHTEAADAARLAARAGVRRLVLHHLVPADDPAIGVADWLDAVRPHFAGQVLVARDGLVVTP